MPVEIFYKLSRRFLFVLLLFGSMVHSESAHIRFDSLRVESQAIVSSLHIQNLMDKQIMKGLRKGMTVVIEYRVQIWHEKSRWMKSLIHERYRRIKINFDHWERRYQVHLKEDETRFFEESELIHYCQQLSSFKIIDVNNLESTYRYRLVAQVSFKPMSMENMQELKHWLSGEAEEFDPDDIRISKSPWKKTGDWMLNIFVNLMGLGDKVITSKSPIFYIANDRMMLEGD
ncbi:DUF4390 domain-containing protein [bacterium]